MTDKPVFRALHPGPSIHALVIGVGDYPHLAGGKATLMPGTTGMGQLSSAPQSARAFAAWLLESMNHPDGLKLASLRLHLSERQNKAFKAKTLAKPVKPQPATSEAIRHAINGWLQDLDANPDHIGIFYFSGHGVSAGLSTALLLSDIGAYAADPFEPAIRLEAFHLGMSRAAARQQVYFIDACRSHSDAFADTFDEGGRAFVTPAGPPSAARVAPIFHATSPGEQAFGERGKASFFTKALLEGFNGAGSDNSDDEEVWVVETATLMRSVEYLVGESSLAAGLGAAQITGLERAAKMRLHKLSRPPEVPVFVDCAPVLASTKIYWGEDPKGHPHSSALRVPFGSWSFLARAPGPPPHSGTANRTVRPPYCRVPISLRETEQ